MKTYYVGIATRDFRDRYSVKVQAKSREEAREIVASRDHHPLSGEVWEARTTITKRMLRNIKTLRKEGWSWAKIGWRWNISGPTAKKYYKQVKS